MLAYICLYLQAAILIFQGTHLLGEQKEPMGVVPAEVKVNPARAANFGGLLVVFGIGMVVTGLLSHVYPFFQGTLSGFRLVSALILAAYGLFLVFGRKVDYTPAPSPASDHGHHH